MQESLNKVDRDFLVLLVASRSDSSSLLRALWASRVALAQWLVVFAVVAWVGYLAAGATAVVSILSLGIGALAAQLAAMRRSIARWHLTDQIVDWNKVQNLIEGQKNEG